MNNLIIFSDTCGLFFFDTQQDSASGKFFKVNRKVCLSVIFSHKNGLPWKKWLA